VKFPAGKPAAEGMEGRDLTKGNLPPQNASRRPSREDAPSALERVRQAASEAGGHIRYYGVPTNGAALCIFRLQVGRLWHRTLSRRSQNAHVLWAGCGA
jgi:hypothetical protein